MRKPLAYRAAALACLIAPAIHADLDPKEFFEAKVRPVLAKNCFGCHTSSKMGGLEMRSREALLKGGASGPAIVPGDPEASLLIRAVRHTHERIKMPPVGKLSEQEIADLAAWIKTGAGNLELMAGGPPMRLDNEKNLRRTVYGYVSRKKLDTTLALFDFPNPNTTNEQRIVTNVPLQRLFFLNSPFVLREAEALASRLEKEGPGDAARIRRAYRLLYSREATEAEIRLGLEFLKGNAWPQYAQVLLAANEFLFVN